ncbi:MAG TPA: PilC/PilY family type IV pilus protein, partial [Vicinamibacterales bacterium]|nr:PilC/PilY family type IV pilus protein [Vicinamibacterales bacterium]
MKTRTLILALVASAVAPQYASAQLDPLLFLKRGQQPGANTNGQPNVIVVVDTANRMQRDQNNDYRDNNAYPKGNLWDATLGVNAGNTTAKYRRKYINLVNTDNGGGSDKFTADRITVVRDQDAEYANVPTVIKDPATGLFQISGFDARTKINIAKISIAEAILRNTAVARFGLIKMRQNNPAVSQNAAAGNIEPVVVSDAGQQLNTDSGGVGGKWKITRPTVSASNGSVGAPATVTVVATDAANSNSTILTTLGKATGAAGSLIPGGADSRTVVDAPVDNMLDDAKTEAARLINADTQCRNTVVVLVVAGAEGQSTNEDPTAKATQFLNVAQNHRVPVYVIAIVPANADRAQLQAIAANSGGVYTEITKAMIDATTAGQPIPQFVKAINTAVQHGYASQADFDTAPTATLPYGPSTEFQVTSPIVGTVDLSGATDINGVSLSNTNISNPATNVHIPQRSNLLVTTALKLPGFDGSLRGFRTYKPVVDTTKSVGYKFVQDGTRLWVACAPGTTTSGPCASLSTAQRNIYTVLPDGSTVSLDPANAGTLQPYLNTTDATSLINTIRALPLGAMVDSTPAIMDAPSLDPPPDADYPGFADTNADRRSIVWIGANDGMFHAIDARLGIEVWAYIPFNLLPKLYTLQSGQPVGDFRFFVDGSPKIADVKINGAWRTYLVLGEGPGGTFYQTFDVTLDDMVNSVAPNSDDITPVLTYFSNSSRIKLKWAFPSYSSFDKSLTLARQGLADCVTAGSADITGPGCTPWGDVAATASAVEKTVGETWSDPAVGEIANNLGGYAVLTGSGFLKYSIQQQANRGGAVAGTTFYIIDVKTGAVFDSKSVGSDGL